MYHHLPTSYMFFFFVFTLFHHLPHVSSKQEFGRCEAKFQCGNITAGFPFSGGIRPQICGHPSLELHCFNNHTSIIISDHIYNVLHIDQTSKTLRLSRAELEGSFCNSTFTDTTLPSDIFALSSTYKSLTVFYLCDPKLSYRSSYTCPGRGPVVVSQNLDYHDSCQGSFTINVPNNFVPEEKELNLRQLEKALQEGFEVKVKHDDKACQECLSSHGICGFENSTQICCKQASSSGCNKLHPLLDVSIVNDICLIPHSNFLKLRCNQYNSTSLFISDQEYYVLHVDQTSYNLTLARDLLDFFCSFTFTNTTLPSEIFEISSTYKSVTFYHHCEPYLPYLSKYTCPGIGPPITVSGNPEYHESCLASFTTNVPKNFLLEEKELNMSNLERVLRKGFEVKVKIDEKACQECLSSHEHCGFTETFPFEVKCIPPHRQNGKFLMHQASL